MRAYYVIIIVLMGVVTYATRVGFIGVARQFELHPLLRRSLEYVPVSVLAALVFPAILAPSGRLESPGTNVYLWAAAITAGIFAWTRKPLVGIIVGVSSMILLRRLT